MSNPRITLEQWRTLVAVVEAGGYAQAARTLHKSQSAVTYAVQQIETQLGVKVFRIEGRKAVLTATGELLCRRAHYLLEEAGGLEQSARTLSAGWETEVRLSVEMIFPTWLLLDCLNRFGAESPNTRIEVIESVLGHHTDALVRGQAELAIFGRIPVGFFGEPLMRVRFLLVAQPDHPLHHLQRKLTMRDLRAHRHLVVRESSPERATATSLEALQRWTVSHMATSIEAVLAGYGYAWLPEEKIRTQLESGTLRPLALREGSERYEELYLIFADREHAGPATQRLAEIIREAVTSECTRAAVPPAAKSPRRAKRKTTT